MATIKIVLDARNVKKDGTSPLKLSVSHNRRTDYIGLGVSVAKSNWDAVRQTVTGGPNRAAVNKLLHVKRLNAENALLSLETSGQLAALDIRQLKAVLAGADLETEAETAAQANGFAATFNRFIEQKTNAGTKKLYRNTLKRLYEFCPGLDRLRYEDITKGWLTDFDAFLARNAPARNARNIHLRNIRAVFNYAIDEEYTTAYPFRRFKIRAEATRKRNLTIEQLRLLRGYQCEPHQEKYRDMFMLMFYLLGINPTDLFNARKSDVVNGRLEYRRAKTGKLYSVLIEPEAWELIDRYGGSGDYLLNIRDTYADAGNFLLRMNKELKRLGPCKRVGLGGKKIIEPLFPQISAYWARHSWATIAYSLDTPKEVISEALGHDYGNAVTSIYIEFDRRKVDRANRLVIDHLLHG